MNVISFIEGKGYWKVSKMTKPNTYRTVHKSSFDSGSLQVRDNVGWAVAELIVVDEPCTKEEESHILEKWAILVAGDPVQPSAQKLVLTNDGSVYKLYGANGMVLRQGGLEYIIPSPSCRIGEGASGNLPDTCPHQLIIYGAPGTGKSWRIKNDTQGMSVIRTTFHPDSDYSTFVGAYKPSMEDDDFKTVAMTGEIGTAGNITKKDGLVTKKHIVYSFRAQAFLDAYVAAWQKCAAYLAATDEDSSKKATQFLVIEEINRGNCAQIFGDIFQLLDREDDGYSSYAIKADNDLSKFVADAFKGDAAKGIPALDLTGVDLGDRDVTPAEIVSGDKLLLPPNLYIWATMNTSDQSLFPMDSAFKRRWDWKYIPISNAGKNYRIEVGNDQYDWWTFLQKANALVESLADSEDKKLGYFFCKADKNGIISLEQFVGKVVFYLWNGVFKDAGFGGETFDDGNEGKLYFNRFFDDAGNPDPAVVKKLMKNLGVPVGDSQSAGTKPMTHAGTELETQPVAAAV